MNRTMNRPQGETTNLHLRTENATEKMRQTLTQGGGNINRNSTKDSEHVYRAERIMVGRPEDLNPGSRQSDSLGRQQSDSTSRQQSDSTSRQQSDSVSNRQSSSWKRNYQPGVDPVLPSSSSSTLPPPPQDSDLRQFSSDDVMWRQSLMFSRSVGEGEGGREGAQPALYSRSVSSPSASLRSPSSPSKKDRFGFGSNARTLSPEGDYVSLAKGANPPVSPGDYVSLSKGDHSAFPRGVPPPESSPGRGRVFSGVESEQEWRAGGRADNAVTGGREQGDFAILSGNLSGRNSGVGSGGVGGGSGVFPSTPSSQQSHLPTPQSPTLTASFASHQSRIPAPPKSPTVSARPVSTTFPLSSLQSPPHASLQSGIPSPRGAALAAAQAEIFGQHQPTQQGQVGSPPQSPASSSSR
jgi:hypothetical protein